MKPYCWRRATCIALAVSLLAAGCATPSVDAPGRPPRLQTPPAPAPARTDGDEAWLDFEQAQRAQAQSALREGRLADAALGFEVLALLRPDDAGAAAGLVAVQQRVAAEVSDRLPRAEAARKRGELELAAQLYLEVLALAPERADAAEALRTIERERNRRSLASRFARQAPTRRAMTADASPIAVAPRSGTGNQIEHATLLARQGELDAAIALLRGSRATSTDAAASALLADLYVQRASRLMERDPRRARAAAEAALAIDRQHAAALALMRRLSAGRGPADDSAPPAARPGGR